MTGDGLPPDRGRRDTAGRDEPIRVLHVDDDPSLRNLTRIVLERFDDRIEVRSRTDAECGLELLEEGDIDCVVSDYEMPEMDGLDFLEAVREEEPKLPFILFTGKGDEEIASDAIGAGVTDYLQKGRGTDQYAMLANRIRNAVESTRRERELRRERALLDSAIDALDDLFYVVSPDRRLVRWNDRIEAVTGYPPEDLETIDVLEFFVGEDRGRVEDAIAEIIEEGTRVTVEADLVTNEGGRCPTSSPAPPSNSGAGRSVSAGSGVFEGSESGSPAVVKAVGGRPTGRER